MQDTTMEVIKDKTEWLRNAQYRKLAIGRLKDPGESKSMSTLIGRWNQTEGKERQIRFMSSIDREEGIVVVVRKCLEKEVAE